jgi:hypothetical protein
MYPKADIDQNLENGNFKDEPGQELKEENLDLGYEIDESAIKFKKFVKPLIEPKEEQNDVDENDVGVGKNISDDYDKSSHSKEELNPSIQFKEEESVSSSNLNETIQNSNPYNLEASSLQKSEASKKERTSQSDESDELNESEQLEDIETPEHNEIKKENTMKSLFSNINVGIKPNMRKSGFLNLFDNKQQETPNQKAKNQVDVKRSIIKLLRKKDYGKIDSKFYEVYIEYKKGDHAIKHTIPLSSIDLHQSTLSQVNKDFMINIKKICEYLGNILKFAQKFEDNCRTFLFPVDLISFFIFIIIDRKGNSSSRKLFEAKDINILEVRIKEVLKDLKLEDAIGYITPYVNFNYDNLADSFLELGENFAKKFELEYEVLKDDLNQIKHTKLYHDILTIRENFLKYFICSDKSENSDELQVSHTSKGMSTLFTKIKDYLSNVFPKCCGEKIFQKEKKNKKICLKCKMLICSKCFKFHKTHQLHDFSSTEFSKIDSDIFLKSIFENSNKKDDENRNNIQRKQNFFTIINYMKIIFYEFFFKTFVKILAEENFDKKFQETKRKFLLDKNLLNVLHTVFLQQKKTELISEISNNLKIFVEVMKEYTKNLFTEDFYKFPTHLLIQDFFIKDLSAELNVNRAILISNTELNYDLPAKDLSLIISQPNSYTEYFLNNYIDKTEQVFINENSSANDVNNQVISETRKINYRNFNNCKKFSTDFRNVLVKCEESKKLENKPTDKNDPNYNTSIEIVNGFNLLNNLKNSKRDPDCENIIHIIQKINTEKKFDECFKNIFYEKKHLEYNVLELKHDYNPRIDLVKFFIGDWLKKLRSVGIPICSSVMEEE